MIPTLSIVLLCASILLSVGTPIALFLILRKRLGLKAAPLAVGAMAFFVFALMLEQALHAFVLRPDEAGNIALMASPVLYMLYGGFAAGIFEESARFISFKFLKRRYYGVQTGVAYGIGHGGIEALLVGALAMINSLALMLMANSGALQALELAGADEQLLAGIASIAAMPPGMFILGGIERVMALGIHISLSVIVWHAANNNRVWWLYPAAIVLHALVNFPAALAQLGYIDVVVTEAIVLVFTALLIFLSVKVHKRLVVSSLL